MNHPWQEENRLARAAALEGGRIALGSAAALDIQTKESPRDIVTAIDLEVERAMLDILAQSAHPVLSEESVTGSVYALHEDKLMWVVDPIDGTANFAHGMDYFGICAGLCRGLDFLAGAVYLPRLDQLYSTAGPVALLNDSPLLHQHRSFSTSLVGAGFSNSVHDAAHRARQYELFGFINERTRGCVRLGSTAVNICFAAAGRLQCAYGLRAKIWDVAAALAVAIAAGCKVIVAPSGDQFSVDYVAGSSDTAAMIHELCVAKGLMAESCRVWEDGRRSR